MRQEDSAIVKQPGSRFALIALLSLLSACAGINLETDFTRQADFHARIIDQQQDQFPELELLAINDEVRDLLDSYIEASDSRERRVEKLQDILYNEEFLNIRYSDEQTFTAQEVFALGEGNCLSVMSLYVAMARHVNVDADFQTVRVQPNWDRRGDLLVLSQHINATGRLSAVKRYVVDFTPEIALQQLTANIISDQQARALYFNNLGVEALVAGEKEQALRYYKNALFLDPELSISWNNIGAVYNRLDQPELAEYSYQMAFSTDNRNSSAINNLAKFYRLRGDQELANRYEEAVIRFNNLNPYYHFSLGRIAMAREDLETARQSFRRALRLNEMEPDFYLGLASVYHELDNDAQAREYLQSAQALLRSNAEIYRPSDQRLRIIDQSTILRDSSPGINIILSD